MLGASASALRAVGLRLPKVAASAVHILVALQPEILTIRVDNRQTWTCAGQTRIWARQTQYKPDQTWPQYMLTAVFMSRAFSFGACGSFFPCIAPPCSRSSSCNAETNPNGLQPDEAERSHCSLLQSNLIQLVTMSILSRLQPTAKDCRTDAILPGNLRNESSSPPCGASCPPSRTRGGRPQQSLRSALVTHPLPPPSPRQATAPWTDRM